MSEDDRFGGLAEHVVRHLGPARRRWTPPDDRGYGVTLHYPEKLPVVSAVTAGLRFQRVEAPRPVELICTLRSGQEGAAIQLLNVAAEYLTAGERKPRAVYDQLVGGEAPLVPDTDVRGLLFGVHPVARDVAVYRDEAGAVALRFLTVLPLTGADLGFLVEGDQGPGRQDRLWRRWRESKVEFWDVHRAS